jgi:N-acetylmuramoyl-L-alanine amidase
VQSNVSRRDVLKCAAAAPVFVSLSGLAASLGAPAAGAASGVAGAIVFLDPGHNGANDASINRQVVNGRGGTKECQTTGTTTDAGYPEHSFNWDVVLRIREELTQLGVRTAMSRGNDNALGPCVDQRAAMANALRPDAIVSIHADGGPPDGRGFHVTIRTRRSTTPNPAPPCGSQRSCVTNLPPRGSRRRPIGAATASTAAQTSQG